MRPSFSQIIRMLETFLMTIPPPPSEPNEGEESEETRSSLSSRSSSGSSLVSRATSKLSVVRHLFASKKASNGKAWCVVPWDVLLWCCKGASLGHAWYKRDLVPCRVAVVLMIQRKVEAQLLQAMYIARSCFYCNLPIRLRAIFSSLHIWRHWSLDWQITSKWALTGWFYGTNP